MVIWLDGMIGIISDFDVAGGLKVLFTMFSSADEMHATFKECSRLFTLTNKPNVALGFICLVIGNIMESETLGENYLYNS